MEEGDSVKVYCNATGSPDLTFLWTKNNTDISNESVLIFKSISRYEAGEYRCPTNNTCGNASMMVYFDVQCELIVVIYFGGVILLEQKTI